MKNELSFILEKSTSSICYLDENGIISFVNDSFCKLFQINKDEVIGNTPGSLLEKYSVDYYLESALEYSRIFRNREDVCGEFTVHLKTGRRFVLEVSIYFLLDGTDRPIAISYIDDITYFRDSELTLIQSYKNLIDLKFALDQSSIITVTDADGVIIAANDNFLKISGYDRNEIVGKTHRIVKSGYHPPDFFQSMWTQISSGKVWHGEIKNKRKDGTYYWVDSHIIPFLNEDGIPFQYISIRENITVRKSAQDLLAASEEKFRLLYENAPIGIMLVGMDGEILECNEYLLKLFGFDKNEFIGNKSIDFLQEEFQEYKLKAFEQLLNRKTNQIYVEEKHKTKEGNFIWTGCYSNAWFDREGKLICILNFIVEIENRKKSEEELLKLDESKNAILNIVAHDLRSPIGGIISLIQIMLEEDDSSENRKYLELALQSGKHAINIANDILEMIQSSNIKNVLDKETTELNDFLKNCIQFQELQAKEKSIEIFFSSTVDKVFSEINRDKMMRAITNLLSNATKFTKKGGKIEVSLTLKNKHPFITVKDSGIGIPKSKQPFLFEKFSIARRAGTRGEKSTGLGMFIVKEIIDRHAGKISFDSEENKGTSFYIEL